MLSIYKASAGSGKTHTLTREYLVMLFRDYHKGNEQSMPHSRILAVTFHHTYSNYSLKGAEFYSCFAETLNGTCHNPADENNITADSGITV
jgi:hypothetical protein